MSDTAPTEFLKKVSTVLTDLQKEVESARLGFLESVEISSVLREREHSQARNLLYGRRNAAASYDEEQHTLVRQRAGVEYHRSVAAADVRFAHGVDSARLKVREAVQRLFELLVLADTLTASGATAGSEDAMSAGLLE